MTERPILFNGAMVRAILEGRKTQTRRVLKCDSHIERIGTPHEWNRGRADDRMKRWEDWGPRTGHVLLHSGVSVFALRCPYGQPGGQLWVRETIRKTGEFPGGYAPSEYVADGAPTVADAWPWQRRTLAAIHCPRGLSRILLEITDVRVQRVQDISEEDAIAEGIRELPLQERSSGAWWCADPLGNPTLHYRTPRAAFAALWDSINERRGFGWNANPWVWCLTFKRVEDGERE